MESSCKGLGIWNIGFYKRQNYTFHRLHFSKAPVSPGHTVKAGLSSDKKMLCQHQQDPILKSLIIYTDQHKVGNKDQARIFIPANQQLWNLQQMFLA